MAKQQTNHQQVKTTSRQSGWGYIQGSAASVTSFTFTFPTAFASTPRVFVISMNGYKLTSSGAPTSAADCSVDAGTYMVGKPTSATTANCSVVHRDATGQTGANAYMVYSWIAEL